jgi:hypothetical protein
MAPAQSKKAKNCLSQTAGQKQKTESPAIPKTKSEEPYQRGEFFSLDAGGAILAGVGTAGAFSLVTFFWRQKKVTTL